MGGTVGSHGDNRVMNEDSKKRDGQREVRTGTESLIILWLFGGALLSFFGEVWLDVKEEEEEYNNNKAVVK